MMYQAGRDGGGLQGGEPLTEQQQQRERRGTRDQRHRTDRQPYRSEPPQPRIQRHAFLLLLLLLLLLFLLGAALLFLPGSPAKKPEQAEERRATAARAAGYAALEQVPRRRDAVVADQGVVLVEGDQKRRAVHETEPAQEHRPREVEALKVQEEGRGRRCDGSAVTTMLLRPS